MNGGSVLRLNNVSVALRRGRGHVVPLLDQICLAVNQGEMTALVGESGSGKTLTSSAIIRLLPRSARASGQIWLGNTDLLRLPQSDMRKIRGRDIGTQNKLWGGRIIRVTNVNRIRTSTAKKKARAGRMIPPAWPRQYLPSAYLSRQAIPPHR